MDTIRHWAQLHPGLWALLIWPLITGLITGVFRQRTPDELGRLPSWWARTLLTLAAWGFDSATFLRAFQRELGIPSTPPPPPGDDQ